VDYLANTKEMQLNDSFYKDVDRAIERSLQAGSPDIALSFGRELTEIIRAKGIQLARLLFRLDEVWQRFDTDDDIETAVLNEMGISPRKFREYSEMYRYVLLEHPELANKPIAGLIDITAAAREGSFSKKDWANLSSATDRTSMVSLRRTANGIRTSGSSRLEILCDEEGNLYAGRGGEMECFGSLALDGSRVVSEAISRMLRSSNIEVDVTGMNKAGRNGARGESNLSSALKRILRKKKFSKFKRTGTLIFKFPSGTMETDDGIENVETGKKLGLDNKSQDNNAGNGALDRWGRWCPLPVEARISRECGIRNPIFGVFSGRKVQEDAHQRDRIFEQTQDNSLVPEWRRDQTFIWEDDSDQELEKWLERILPLLN